MGHDLKFKEYDSNEIHVYITVDPQYENQPVEYRLRNAGKILHGKYKLSFSGSIQNPLSIDQLKIVISKMEQLKKLKL